jgi:dimethylglycine dehydrogenase
MRWFDDHMIDGVRSAIWARRSAASPGRPEIAQGDRPADRWADRRPALHGLRRLRHRLVRPVARMSVTGELGYEINCRYGDHIALRRMLLEAGADLGMRECGFNAMLSLRLEKSFGIWSAEFTQGYTPGMTGMDRWIAWDKGLHRPRRGDCRTRRQRPGADGW